MYVGVQHKFERFSQLRPLQAQLFIIGLGLEPLDIFIVQLDSILDQFPQLRLQYILRNS